MRWKTIRAWISHIVVMLIVMGVANIYAWLRDQPFPTWGLFLAAMIGLLLSKVQDLEVSR